MKQGSAREDEGVGNQSYQNEEFLLEVLFAADEVTRALARLKKRKAPGPDGLMAEHLKRGGQIVVIWLMKILNAIVELESVPMVFKKGVEVPIYKGGGKDPMKTDSYRVITHTSMVAKVLKFLLLQRLESIFLEAGLPHIKLTRLLTEGVSCGDAVFATQEVIAKYLRGGSCAYMCLYDLQKAFDSVKYPRSSP